LFNTLHRDNLAVEQVLMEKLINGKNRFKRTGGAPFECDSPESQNTNSSGPDTSSETHSEIIMQKANATSAMLKHDCVIKRRKIEECKTQQLVEISPDDKKRP
jgi:hypothetical protein